MKRRDYLAEMERMIADGSALCWYYFLVSDLSMCVALPWHRAEWQGGVW